jgi:hypothetical protein
MVRATPRSTLCAWCADDLAKAGQRWCSTGRHGVAFAGWTSPTARMCRDCQHTRNQAYRAEHLEEAIAYSRAYHAAHREELIVRNRAYYQANRDQLLEAKRVYYQERRELIKAKVRAYRPRISAASREKARQRHRAKHQVYQYNQKLAQRRRWLASLRGER